MTMALLSMKPELLWKTGLRAWPAAIPAQAILSRPLLAGEIEAADHVHLVVPFLDGGGTRGLITAPGSLYRALSGETGTVMVP